VTGASRLPYTLLDVFTDRPLAGNALAVVQDADGVPDETMLRFARETRLSETTFVQAARVDEADYRNRIFTVSEEVPFAGHPSLGTAVAVARHRGQTQATYVQETVAGLQPVEVAAAGGRWTASVLQNPAELGVEVDPGPVMAALGLAAADAHPELPAQVATTGLPHLLAPLADASALPRVRPDYDLLAGLLTGLGAKAVYLWAIGEGSGIRARMFSPSVAEGEDPATGSAAGPLAAYLQRRRGLDRIEIEQGVEMGRRSLLRATMEDDRPRVGGDVVVVVVGEVALG
jgi:trans-2,3-dihydro-3-hydroxyanthranilate isomerase